MCVPPQSECVPLLSRAEGCEAGERTDVRVGGLYQKYARVERDQGVEAINTASCAATEVAGTPLCRAEPAGRGAASRLACLEKVENPLFGEYLVRSANPHRVSDATRVSRVAVE